MLCQDRFFEIYKREPEEISFSPYRICPIGAHSDHNLGKITGLAIDKGIHIAYRPKQNGVIEIVSLQFPKRAQWHVKEIGNKTGDWVDYLRGATWALAKQYSLSVGLCGVIEGSLPIGGHKPGDAMQVDWAGDPLWITDKVTGELYPGYLFVAVLPCSWYTYAEVCGDTKSENWLLCHVHAFHYFGGVTRLLIPDNAKTGVIANNRYETILNKSYQEMADHYGTAIVPARVRKPDDKAAAESSVRYVSTWITAALRDRTFFSVSEAQQAVAEKLEEVNRAPFQKRPGCRLSAFEQEEKGFLRPLPILGYEPSVWSQVKVGMDYLISDGKNKYSIKCNCVMRDRRCIKIRILQLGQLRSYSGQKRSEGPGRF